MIVVTGLSDIPFIAELKLRLLIRVVLDKQKFESGFESGSESTLLSLNPNPDSTF